MDCCAIIANPKVSIQQQDELMKNADQIER